MSETQYDPGTEKALWADRMGYHRANEVTVPRHQALRELYIALAGEVIDRVPPGRERALAMTSLQESLMWANAGVAINLAPLAKDALPPQTTPRGPDVPPEFGSEAAHG